MLDCPTAILLRALAAPVLAPSISFLKKPAFLALGVEKPPNPPPLSPKLLVFSQPMADCAPCLASRFGAKEVLVNGVCGRNSYPRVPADVTGRPLSMLPNLFLLARLPALVALNPPAEWPLIMLWLVMEVWAEEIVALLCTPLEEFVALDFMVNVLPSAARPSSYADFLFLMEGLRPPIADIGLE